LKTKKKLTKGQTENQKNENWIRKNKTTLRLKDVIENHQNFNKMSMKKIRN
jgi:hypothetical protein